MKIGVISDTHGFLDPRVEEIFAGVNHILHAGDVCTASVLAELAEYAPVVVVIGNNDQPDVADWGATPTAELDLDGLSLSMGRIIGLLGRNGAGKSRLMKARKI